MVSRSRLLTSLVHSCSSASGGAWPSSWPPGDRLAPDSHHFSLVDNGPGTARHSCCSAIRWSLGGAWRQLGSLAFTMRPFVFFLVRIVVVRYGTALRSLVMPLGLSASFACIVVLGGLLLNGEQNLQYGFVEYGGSIMYGEYLGGSYLGLPLFGRFGVNSLAETYFVYSALSLAALAISGRRIVCAVALAAPRCAASSSWRGWLRECACLGPPRVGRQCLASR